MDAITLKEIKRDESTVHFKFEYPDKLSGFFLTNRYIVEYGTDISDVPESLLFIPWVANVCPVAWANGVAVELPALDERFLESLADVREAFRDMYPQFMDRGDIRCQTPVTNTGEERDTGTNALLFSGGVDALDTYYRHRDEEPTLVCIHGFDVDFHDTNAWTEKMERVSAFAQSRGLDLFFVRTNMMEFLDDFMLNAHFNRYLQSDWYDAVQQGLGLTGLCAPLAFTEGFETIYMADGASRKYDIKVGNHPKIVDNIAWGRTSVQSDGFEFTRQEKIERLAEFIRENGIHLHTCLKPGPGNCNKCEKCLRTAFGLVLAGLDPHQHGYRIDAESFDYAREQLESGGWKLGPAKATMWRDLQDHAHRETYQEPGAEAFFDWLARADIDRFVDYSNSSGSPAYKLARRLPRSPYVHTPRQQAANTIWDYLVEPYRSIADSRERKEATRTG
ncbi:hypothetical protein [Natrinema versiforme]|uniref:Uncharacterized protein n=1 Tax=Natrinema versiforme JCM 10478 TaxID=1227496 RepID=L9Y6T6_9EURY|nr:hypothetical protein [Natrinema versiforme]ELY69775.1 hypothetical protein C489_04362 [Natrinema versiforme JCM 10478]